MLNFDANGVHRHAKCADTQRAAPNNGVCSAKLLYDTKKSGRHPPFALEFTQAACVVAQLERAQQPAACSERLRIVVYDTFI